VRRDRTESIINADCVLDRRVLYQTRPHDLLVLLLLYTQLKSSARGCRPPHLVVWVCCARHIQDVEIALNAAPRKILCASASAVVSGTRCDEVPRRAVVALAMGWWVVGRYVLRHACSVDYLACAA